MALELWELAGADPDVRFSPYCWRIRYALAHKGLTAETHAWRFTDKEAIAFSGQGAVPVLRHDGHVVTDSFAIADYLDATFPAHPLMEGPQARAQCLFVKQWTQAMLGPIILRTILPELFAALAPQDKDYFRTSREQRLGKRLEDVAAPLAQSRAEFAAALLPLRLMLTSDAQPYVSGQTPGYADYIVMGHLMWARTGSSVDLIEATDPVHAWFDRMLDLYNGLGRNAPRVQAA